MFSTAATSSAVPQPVPAAPETVVGAGTCCVGTLRSAGCVRIDGAVEGTLAVAGTVIIGESGRVNATITAHNGHVAGAVRGSITIVEQLELASTGTIRGQINGAITGFQPPRRSAVRRLWDHICTAAGRGEQRSAGIVGLLQGMGKDRAQQGDRHRFPSFLHAQRQALLERGWLWPEEDWSYYVERWRRSVGMYIAAVLISVLLGTVIVVLLNLVQR